MPSDVRLALRAPEVSLETFDGESIVIDFGSGCYYSLSASASEMLLLLAAGATPGDVGARLAARYPGAARRVEADLRDFLARATAERILVLRPSALPPTDVTLPAAPAAYDAPDLARFDDMREMLLLDPIHELDQATWGGSSPGRPPGAAPRNGAEGRP